MRYILRPAVVVALLAGPLRAGVPFSVEERNLDSARLAAVMAGSLLQDEYALTTGSLDLIGTYSADGWTMTVAGTVDARVVSIAYIGQFATATGAGSFTSLGSVDADLWEGLGNYSYTDPDALTTDTEWTEDAFVTPQGQPKKPKRDRRVTKRWNNEDGTDSYTYFKTIDGVVVSGPHTGTSGLFGRQSRSVQFSINAIDDGIEVAGTADSLTGTFVGTVTVPEPLAAAPAALSLLLTRRRRHLATAAATRAAA